VDQLQSTDSLPQLIDQLKERLPQALFEKFKDSLSIDGDRRLKFAEYKVRVLEERLRLIRIKKYGPESEKLSDDQLELLELEPGVSSAEVETESQREQLQLPLKATRKHPGRQELPAELPRTVIGYETTEQLDVEPASENTRRDYLGSVLPGLG
jgi:Transposase C of IS166 homeodomain